MVKSGRTKKKKQLRRPKVISVFADITKGAEWLHQLTESDFRDQVLSDLFARMKAEGEIGVFVNIHGRNEHGIDWIVQERGKFLDRIVGIQAKSRLITRQGDSYSDSALEVKMQCESAYDNRFTLQGNDVRLDDVQLWTSAHITADAEAELTAPLSRHKISVVKAERVFALIERFCPSLVAKIPGLAETGYVLRMANPDPLSVRLLGIQLNPKKHFLEPRFSKYPNLSTGRFFDRKAKKMREETPIHLDDIIKSGAHASIVGPELSGKTYLMKRICCQLADLGHLPVLVDGNELFEKMPKSTPHLLIKHLTWYPLKVIETPEQIGRTIYLLIDNADVLTDAQIGLLHDTSHRKIIIILTGRSSRTLSGFKIYYISGVQFRAVHRFIRSLDIDQVAANALADRAVQYIHRTFGTSGLPMNAFTVSVMLGECQVARRQLATPTMGRLIERFVEGQLGSHADSMRVDFETKNQFLTTIGGSNLSAFPMKNFRRRLAKFISVHGHPHNLGEFEEDLIESGLLERYNTDVIRWSRSIFREYFWVRNLVREKKFPILAKRLLRGGALSIAAIAGSQMGNAHTVLVDILDDINCEAWMNPKQRTKLPNELPTGDFLPSDAEEETLLSRVEDEAKQGDIDKNLPAKQPFERDVSITTPDEATDKLLSEHARRFMEEKHYLVSNISALLVNARSLSRDDKEKAVQCVFKSNLQLAKHFSEIFQKVSKGTVTPLNADMLGRFLGLAVNDMMIGDPFLADIFRGLKRKTLSIDGRLALTDISVACGVLPPIGYIEVLTPHADIADVIAVYLRLVNTYYFRFHKEKEKALLRHAMKEVRKLAKGFSLPPVA